MQLGTQLERVGMECVLSFGDGSPLFPVLVFAAVMHAHTHAHNTRHRPRLGQSLLPAALIAYRPFRDRWRATMGCDIFIPLSYTHLVTALLCATLLHDGRRNSSTKHCHCWYVSFTIFQEPVTPFHNQRQREQSIHDITTSHYTESTPPSHASPRTAPIMTLPAMKHRTSSDRFLK